MLDRKHLYRDRLFPQYDLHRRPRCLFQPANHLVRLFLRLSTTEQSLTLHRIVCPNSEQSCGNGIVEDGEECDPGSADSACCDAATCRFRSGAVCDPLNSLCCTTMCQVAGSGTVCRASIDTRCDKEEVCDGSSSSCPKDEFESNGESSPSHVRCFQSARANVFRFLRPGKGCGDGLSCASGVCTSRDLQCRNAGASLDITSACPTSAVSLLLVPT